MVDVDFEFWRVLCGKGRREMHGGCLGYRAEVVAIGDTSTVSYQRRAISNS